MERAQRALQLWSILVLAARSRQIWTYEIVGNACGLPAVSIGDFLRPIQQFCAENNLPPLTSIIVNKSDGMPGEGFLAENVPLAQSQTFEKNWQEVRAPSVQQLAEAYTRAPGRRSGSS